jgi:AcrR family transcriptional regulator
VSDSQATSPLRRQPLQQRSAKRVEQMLDASAHLIDEIGYDALSTTLIAKRAGVAVGSLYQFFPDKRAIVQALTHRNMDRFLCAVSERLAGEDPGHWWGVVDSVLDIYLDMHRSVPGFSKVHFGDVVDRQLLDEGRDNNKVISDALADLVRKYVRNPGENLSLVMTIAIETTDALLKLAFARDSQGDPEVVDETKYLIKGYLSTRLGE